MTTVLERVSANNTGTSPSATFTTAPSSGEWIVWACVYSSSSGKDITQPSAFAAGDVKVDTGTSSPLGMLVCAKLSDGTEGATLTGTLNSTSGWTVWMYRLGDATFDVASHQITSTDVTTLDTGTTAALADADVFLLDLAIAKVASQTITWTSGANTAHDGVSSGPASGQHTFGTAYWTRNTDTTGVSDTASWASAARAVAAILAFTNTAAGGSVDIAGLPGDSLADGPDGTVTAAAAVSITGSSADALADSLSGDYSIAVSYNLTASDALADSAPGAVSSATTVTVAGLPADGVSDGPAGTVTATSSVSIDGTPADALADAAPGAFSADTILAIAGLSGDVLVDSSSGTVTAGVTVTITSIPADALADSHPATLVTATVHVGPGTAVLSSRHAGAVLETGHASASLSTPHAAAALGG